MAGFPAAVPIETKIPVALDREWDMHAQHPGVHLLFREVVEIALGRATWLGREKPSVQLRDSTGLEPVSPLSLNGTLLAIYLKLIVASGC